MNALVQSAFKQHEHLAVLTYLFGVVGTSVSKFNLTAELNRIVWQKLTDVSEERTSSFLLVDE
jgi:hypothetical protein